MVSFSHRIPFEPEENDLYREWQRKRAARDRLWDLTASNPSALGFDYPEAGILESLSAPAALHYAPDPKGLESARRAVAQYYLGRGATVSSEDVFLTSGTSEGYSLSFKLLGDPSDPILVPQPSYPLFDTLAALDALSPTPYRLDLQGSSGAWRIDFDALEGLAPDASAIVAVHPNNPTGSFVAPGDAERLLDIAKRHGLPLIVDEVFLDYVLSDETPRSFARARRGLVLVLSGLSKLAGLPGLKLAWIALAGEPALRDEASRRLEHIADAYLSVGTPVQQALPRLLELGARVRQQILERVRANRKSLERVVPSVPAVSLLPVQGGWYQPLRLPAISSSEAWALEILREVSVYVHPGLFFGFAREAYVVVSLLPQPRELEQGMERLLKLVGDRVDSRRG